ncbi:retinol dehydrogenase 11-like [Babylonia areolata]|uniref:retinol dehydrogenase 11-like n=1 Tax=Babylonia areolata TaxID=304850 RepID=UPI003FD51906
MLKDYVPVLTGVAAIGAASLLLLRLRRRRNRKLGDLKIKLTGKTAIVTGANTGIGFWTAQELASRGARVILACRSLERGEEARRKMVAATGNEAVDVYRLDLSDFSSVRQFAEQVKEKEQRLDILVNNAGIFAGALPPTPTDQGLDMTLTVNHLGPYLLTRLLIDLLKRSAPSRVVNVSSEAQRYPIDFDFDALCGKKPLSSLKGMSGFRATPSFSAYSLSKLGNVLFTTELAKRLTGSDVTVCCVHPGVVSTEIWRNLNWFQAIMVRLIFFFRMIKPKEGAETLIYACISPDVLSGSYYIDCALADDKVNPLASDSSVTGRLWDVSAQLTNIPKEISSPPGDEEN